MYVLFTHPEIKFTYFKACCRGSCFNEDVDNDSLDKLTGLHSAAVINLFRSCDFFSRSFLRTSIFFNSATSISSSST